MEEDKFRLLRSGSASLLHPSVELLTFSLYVDIWKNFDSESRERLASPRSF